MDLPSSVKESEAYIYADADAAALIIQDEEFEPIQGSQTIVRGNIIGMINGKMVIISDLLF